MTHRSDALAASARSPGSRARARLHVRVGRRRVVEVRLQIYEPPRFFEAFLRGRALHRAARHHRPHLRDLPGRLPDSAPAWPSRTPAGSSSTAPIADLRRLLYCGEWISSHALHIYLLHAPDFLGYPDVVEMARDHRAHRRAGAAR